MFGWLLQWLACLIPQNDIVMYLNDVFLAEISQLSSILQALGSVWATAAVRAFWEPIAEGHPGSPAPFVTFQDALISAWDCRRDISKARCEHSGSARRFLSSTVLGTVIH